MMGNKRILKEAPAFGGIDKVPAGHVRPKTLGRFWARNQVPAGASERDASQRPEELKRKRRAERSPSSDEEQVLCYRLVRPTHTLDGTPVRDKDIPGKGFTLLRSKNVRDPFPNVESTFVEDGGLIYGWPEGDWIAVEGDNGARCGYMPRIMNNMEYFVVQDGVLPPRGPEELKGRMPVTMKEEAMRAAYRAAYKPETRPGLRSPRKNEPGGERTLFPAEGSEAELPPWKKGGSQ